MTSIRGSKLFAVLLALPAFAMGCDDPPAVINLVPGDTATIAQRDGYRAQCQAWEGDLCIEPWIQLNGADIVDPVPNCVDDTTSLRPLWYGDPDAQAEVFCWIATGDSSWVQADDDGGTVLLGGWMYGEFDDSVTDCAAPGDFRRYSDVNVPTVGVINFSFDLMSEERDGSFSRYECNW